MGFSSTSSAEDALSTDEAALVVARNMVSTSWAHAEEIQSHRQQEELHFSRAQFGQLVCDFLSLLYNLVDRLAFEILTEEQRSDFTPALGSMAITLLVDSALPSADEAEKQELKEGLATELAQDNFAYARYPLQSDEDTVFLKFAQRAAENVLNCGGDDVVIGVLCVSAMGHYYRLRAEIEGILHSVQ